MLQLENVSLSVDDGKEILKHIDLTIGSGKFVVITGPNGGGKSTLAKTIAGINGEDITNRSITERANLGIGFAFQQPVRFKGITVRDMVRLAAGGDLPESQLCTYLCDVGLCAKDYIDRELNASLSGGEIKRIEIAMSLARKSKLTIFDEPEAGIDLWSFNSLIEVFLKLRREIQGSSILIISHQERILEIADEIVVLAGGKITAQGPRDQILPHLLKGESCSFCPNQEGFCHE